MKRIILHDQGFTVGGPKAVLDGIEKQIGHRHEFVRLLQKDSCGFNPIKAVKFILDYRKKINSLNADAIYICGLEYNGLLMTLAAKLSNVKRVILSVHGSYWDIKERSLRISLVKYLIEPLEVLLADKVFTVCEEAQRHIKALKFARKNCNAGVVYNMFPQDDYNSIPAGLFRMEYGVPSDSIVVAIVGRVCKDKGHQYIIDAIKKFDDTRYVFVIVGIGDYIQEYERRCEDEIKEKRVILTGARNDVNNILKDSNIFLFATLHENHSIALLEAVNMRCAALVTNVGGNPEIIEDGKGGILIPVKDSDSIVDGLRKFADHDMRKQCADYSYSCAKDKFSFNNTYGKLDTILVDETR